MKLLERISFVQFFLYERLDLDTGLNTAFLGPNGTGKSALMDAIQLVMLAADRNRMHFNAAGEGKKDGRSLRDYCLGAHEPSNPDVVKRRSSNTYVSLSFRDQESGTPFTAGVALSASVEHPQAELRALFLLPGVSLDSSVYVQRQDGREIALPYRQFMHLASQRCQDVGTVFWSTENREEFTRRLLIDHLQGPGDSPNPRAFRSAFSRSLKLGTEITDLNETLRVHLIEAQPTGVRAFRERLDDVRKLRDLVRTLKVRIQHANTTVAEYETVKAQKTLEANLEALKAVYAGERIGEEIADAEERLSQLEQRIEADRFALDRAKDARDEADREREAAKEALKSNPDYERQRGTHEALQREEAEFARAKASLKQSVAAMISALMEAGSLPEMSEHRSAFGQTLEKVEKLSLHHQNDTSPDLLEIQACSTAVASLHGLLRKAASQAERDHDAARAGLADAKLALERAGRGASELRPETMALLRELKEVGIVAEPVCDLVRLSDPEWQPIIEAYLGPHIEALLVPASKEVEAIELYRGLRGARTVYGVKLALPSRLRSWHAPAQGRFAAQLVEGDNMDAVRYLRGELGSTTLVESSSELRAGSKALSKEGMVSTGGGIERRRLSADPRLGRMDSEERRERAALRLKVAQGAEADAKARKERVERSERRFAPFADAMVQQQSIGDLFSEILRRRSSVERLQKDLQVSETDELDAAQERKRAADAGYIQAQERVGQLERELGAAEKSLENETNCLDQLTLQRKEAATLEQARRTHTLYSANEVDHQRQRFDARFGDAWDEKLTAVNQAIAKARSTAQNADREAWSLCAQYLSDYHLTNNALASDDWLCVLSWLHKERQRLVELELAEKEAEAEKAYRAAVGVFRTDVAHAILEGFARIEEQIHGLNTVLGKAPAFSNGDRYVFRKHVVVQHQPLYDFLMRVRDVGGADDDMFGPGEVPETFRELVEGNVTSELLLDTSPLQDCRRFFTYDIEIFHEKESKGYLSRRFGRASGGEHRTPVYLIFGAAIASAYGKAKGGTRGGGLMLLDEAFEKMDPQNVRATATFLNGLGLQLIMAGPESDQAKLSSFLHVYYDMSRYGSKAVQFNKTVVNQQARELLQSDNFYANPVLLEQEIARQEAERESG